MIWHKIYSEPPGPWKWHTIFSYHVICRLLSRHIMAADKHVISGWSRANIQPGTRYFRGVWVHVLWPYLPNHTTNGWVRHVFWNVALLVCLTWFEIRIQYDVHLDRIRADCMSTKYPLFASVYLLTTPCFLFSFVKYIDSLFQHSSGDFKVASLSVWLIGCATLYEYTCDGSL